MTIYLVFSLDDKGFQIFEEAFGNRELAQEYIENQKQQDFNYYDYIIREVQMSFRPYPKDRL